MEDLNLNIIIYPFVAVVSILGLLINKEKIFFKFLAIILIILAILRFDTGYDYYWYYAVSKVEFMNDIQIDRLYIQLEPGIKKIVDFVRYLGHPQYFFAITGVVTFGLIFFTIYKESNSPLMSLNLFMFLELGFQKSNVMIMQMLAVSIIFYSAFYINKNKKIKFIILVLLAAIFLHNSAIICLIMLLVPTKEIKIPIWIIYTFLIGFSLKEILPKLALELFPQYYYLVEGGREKFSSMGLKDIKMSLIFIILFFILDLKIKNNIWKPLSKSKKQIFLKNLYIFGAINSFILFYFIGGHLPFRIGAYFYIYIFLLIPNYIEYFSSKLKKEIKIIIILILNFWIIRGIVARDYIILNKKRVDEKGEFIPRGNSYGFKVFFNKTEKDMERFLPGDKEHK